MRLVSPNLNGKVEEASLPCQRPEVLWYVKEARVELYEDAARSHKGNVGVACTVCCNENVGSMRLPGLTDECAGTATKSHEGDGRDIGFLRKVILDRVWTSESSPHCTVDEQNLQAVSFCKRCWQTGTGIFSEDGRCQCDGVGGVQKPAVQSSRRRGDCCSPGRDISSQRRAR